MSLVYCCSQRSFFNAVNDWVEEHPSPWEELSFISAILKSFLTQSTYAPLFCVRSSNIFSFELTTFEKSFKQWASDEKKGAPDHVKRITRVYTLSLKILNDEPWAIENSLVVNDLLTEQEKAQRTGPKEGYKTKTQTYIEAGN